MKKDLKFQLKHILYTFKTFYSSNEFDALKIPTVQFLSLHALRVKRCNNVMERTFSI